MDTTGIPHDERPPDLVASDIPWGRQGLSFGVVYDPADVEAMKLCLHEATHGLHQSTRQLARSGIVNRELLAAWRAERERSTALAVECDALRARVRELEAE